MLFSSFILVVPLAFVFQNLNNFDKKVGELRYPIHIGHVRVLAIGLLLKRRVSLPGNTLPRDRRRAHAAVISTQSPENTARAIAASIDQFLFDAPPVGPTPEAAGTSFDEELLAAYETALAHRSDTRPVRVWAFPVGKPQLFTASLRSCRKASSCASSPNPQGGAKLTDRMRSTRSFRVTTCVDSFSYENWSVRLYEPLRRLHRPARWDAARIRCVSEEVSLALEHLLPRADGIPRHWRPMHGDFVPWNLREDSLDQLWLLDWTVGLESLPALAEVASFWLSHRNVDPGENSASFTRRRDSARAARELAAFRVIGARADVGVIDPLVAR